MVKYQQRSPLDNIFRALADPTRRAITEHLAGGTASVMELAEPFSVTLPSVMKHLAVLEDAALIEHRKEGRVRYCSLTPAPLESADQWIGHYRRFWTERLVSLREFLREET